MKIPKAEDIVVNGLAILSMVLLLSGLIRLMSNGSYGPLLLSIGLALLIVFIIVVVALRRNREKTSVGSRTFGNS